MITEYVDAWFRNREKLKKYLETHPQELYAESYTDLLKVVIKVIINNPEEILDEAKIIEWDPNDYQGDYIWLIPRKDNYHMTTVTDCVFCYIEYGSWRNGQLPDERRVKDYMYLSLQLLQNMMTFDEVMQNNQIDYEAYMK